MYAKKPSPAQPYWARLKGLNARVPIFVANMLLLKIINEEGFNFLRINVLQLMFGFFSLFQCAIKLIHKKIDFFMTLFTANKSGGCYICDRVSGESQETSLLTAFGKE